MSNHRALALRICAVDSSMSETALVTHKAVGATAISNRVLRKRSSLAPEISRPLTPKSR